MLAIDSDQSQQVDFIFILIHGFEDELDMELVDYFRFPKSQYLIDSCDILYRKDLFPKTVKLKFLTPTHYAIL